MPLTKQALKAADCVIITTDHSAYDYEMIAQESKLVIDTRGAIKEKRSNVVRF